MDYIDEPDTVDDQLEPTNEPKSSRRWLAMILSAGKAFDDYQQRADNIDKLYASIGELASTTRDRQFQLFWANIQVVGPSIYSRPPVPVVVPKFKDRRPLYRVASELLERTSIVAFDLSDINSVMMLLRDDLTISARGVAWVRYETKAESDAHAERVCIEHLDRKDFLHEPARNWLEVGWVARRAWMSKKEMRKRFREHSGDAYQDAEYSVRKEDRDNGAADRSLKAGVWELWSKDENKVVWVAEGCDRVLDEGKPHLKLEGFFPCPRPAYGTTQRRSLIPVPDMLFYKDQLEELNELTARIHVLADAIRVRGFYPAGMSEVGDAIETALKTHDRGQVMVPVSNWAAWGNGSAKDTIVWLPIDMIVTTIAQLVELRRQVIDDVYQIMGLSDIMRGSTEASETLGAQQLKSQYGSIRIRDKQSELVRVARDALRISAEIIAENFDKKTMLDMSQMEIPSNADIKNQIEALTERAEAEMKGLQEQAQQALQNPEMAQQAQANPEQAQQMLQQAQQAIIARVTPEMRKLEETPTIEQVAEFLRDQHIRPFVLDIETDSTIQPDEDAEKQRRSEFMMALGGTLQQLTALVGAVPEAAPFAAEMLKFAVAPFRAGRSMETVIEEFADQMTQRAQQPQDKANPEAEALKAKAEAESQRMQTEMQIKQAELQGRQQEMQLKAQIETAKADAEINARGMEMQARQAETQAKLQQMALQAEQATQKHAQEMERGAMDLRKSELEIERMALQSTLDVQRAEIDAATKLAQPAPGANV